MARESKREWLGYVFPILLSVGSLLTLGLMSIRAWAGEDADDWSSEWSKQIMFICFGLAIFFTVQLINYRKLLRFSLLLYILTMLPVLYTIAARVYNPTQGLPFAHPVKGACAWMQFPGFSIEPAELTKVALIMFLAWILRHEQQQREHSLKMLIQSLIFAGVGMIFVLMQPDLGMVLTMGVPVLVMLFASGIRKRHFAGLFLAGVLMAPVIWYSGHCSQMDNCPICPDVPVLNHLPQFIKHYQRQRVQAMLSDDPEMQEKTNYQQHRVLIAMGSGGLDGKGAGEIPIGRHIPEVHNDMIVALIGEQYGFVGVAMMLLAYVLLFGTGVAVAEVHREPSGRLLALGLVTMLAGQTMMNLGVAMRLLPVTGLTLPFVSYGGSSLVGSFLAVGLILNVARYPKRLLL